MSDFISEILMTNKSALIGAITVTAGLFTFNKYYDFKISKRELLEEQDEKEKIRLLKQKLSERTLRKYGLSKSDI